MKEKLLRKGKIFQPIPPGVNLDLLAKQVKEKKGGYFSSSAITAYHLIYGRKNLNDVFNLLNILKIILLPK